MKRCAVCGHKHEQHTHHGDGTASPCLAIAGGRGDMWLCPCRNYVERSKP